MSQLSLIRSRFLEFARSRNHFVLGSLPVIPRGLDPSGTYFVNSGLFAFRDWILGKSGRPTESDRVVSCQACVRLGGKHNDLSNVGLSPFHLTFFEMLGTWYLGQDSIERRFEQSAVFAIDFLKNEVGLDLNKMSARCSEAEMLTTGKLWASLGVRNVIPMKNREDLLWEMADSGPRGTSTEIDYTPKNSANPLELWNFVRINERRSDDGLITKLPNEQSLIDTGLGLERLLSVLTENSSVFETDAFSKIEGRVRDVLGLDDFGRDQKKLQALRIVCDHARTVVVAMSDGLFPSPLGLGSQIRKLIERCLLQAKFVFRPPKLEPFVFKLVETVAETLGDFYTKINDNQDDIAKIILNINDEQSVW